MSIDTGGSAFPSQFQMDGNGNVVSNGDYGMTLRDYFAGQAMLTLGDFVRTRMGEVGIGLGSGAMYQIASAAYQMADVMLAVRSNEKGPA